MSKLLIDLNLLTVQNLSVDEYITLLALDQCFDYSIKDDVIESLQHKNFIKVIKEEDEEIHIIRQKGKLLIESSKLFTAEDLTTVNKQVKRSKDELNEFITEFRLLWKGLKPGSMGSEAACKNKMTRWMIENPSYTKENILNAAKTYINSLDNYKFLQQADYFIYKKDVHGESSRLSAFIDEDVKAESDGWSSNLN